MQNGGFQNNPLMRLTLGLTLLFLTAFVVTNFALYFGKMNLNPSSVASYYRGSVGDFHPARSYQSMLEVSHGHLAMMALVFLLLTHLSVFTPFSKRTKVLLIIATFLSGLLDEGAGWLVRFVDPAFAWVKVAAFLTLQGSLVTLLFILGLFLLRWARGEDTAQSMSIAKSEESDRQ